MKKYLAIFIFALVFVGAYSSYEYLKFHDANLRLTVCDVGQGDAIFIRSSAGTDILIDGGPDKKVLDCLSRNMPFWDREIDAIILTHHHADHLTGVAHVIDTYSVKSFYSSGVEAGSDIEKVLASKLADKNLNAKKLTKGGKFSDLSGFSISVLFPRPEDINEVYQNKSNIDLNTLSLVTLLKFGNFSALLTADAEENELSKIKNNLVKINVLKVPHQGSSDGLNKEILSILNPEIAIISVGENNYGHPSKEIIELLKSFGTKVVRTDIEGSVTIISNGEDYWID